MDKETIRELEDQRYAAMCAADAATLEKLLADSLVYTHSYGGSDGCNRYATKYTAWENNLKIGPNVVGTRAACSPPVMDEATTFLGILGRTAGFRRDGNRMMLFDGEGRPLAAFQRIEP